MEKNSETSVEAHGVPKELLEILACPVCKKDVNPVEYEPNRHGLQCTGCENIYPVKDGIPVMLAEEAIKK